MSATLYMISENYRTIHDLALSSDDGMDQELQEAIERIQDEIENKADAVCYIIAALEEEAESLSKEAERLLRHAKTKRAKGERLLKYLRDCMITAGLSNLKSKYHQIKVVQGRASVVIDDNKTIPDSYCELVRQPVKSAIKDALIRGFEVPGARLETGEPFLVIR